MITRLRKVVKPRSSGAISCGEVELFIGAGLVIFPAAIIGVLCCLAACGGRWLEEVLQTGSGGGWGQNEKTATCVTTCTPACHPALHNLRCKHGFHFERPAPRPVAGRCRRVAGDGWRRRRARQPPLRADH